MEIVNLNIAKFEGQTLTILEGSVLAPKAPEKLNLNGTIESPGNFLEKRINVLTLETCNLVFNRDTMQIILSVDETDGYKKGIITGGLKLHTDFKKLKINTGESWTPFDLADFIRVNRSFFASKEVAADLVKKLRDFTTKVNKIVENFKDDKANYSVKRAQAVESNLPPSFEVNIAIFVGQPIQNIPVEINIHPETLNCQLCSPDANDLIVKYRESAIDDQIDRIRKIAPDLLIIEQ